MEKHIQRFRRSKKDAAAHIILPATTPSNNATTTTTTDTSASNSTPLLSAGHLPTSGKPPGTPPSGGCGGGNTLLPLPAASKPPRKHSPFRSFRLRPSHKRARARDSPPSSLPHSPTLSAERPRTAHAGVGAQRKHDHAAAVADDDVVAQVEAGDGEEGGGSGSSTGGRKITAKMPRFLELNDKERFSDLVWQERNRLALASTNPSPSYRWAKVSGPHLRALDRYLNIQPWQNNRVRLKVPEGGVDYINASPIVLRSARKQQRQRQHEQHDGASAAAGAPVGTEGAVREEGEEGEVHRYIAMQGPKQNSQDHVWRMVVEQLESPAVIVMLTETHEAGNEKCWPYFPHGVGDTLEVNPADEFGDRFCGAVTCKAIEETPAGDAIELRRLVVRLRRRKEVGKNGRTDGAAGKRPDTPVERQALDMQRPSEDDLDTLKSPTAEVREGLGQLSGLGERMTDDASAGETGEGGEEVVEERTVYHFLYKKWPDFGVPALEDLESFFTLMRLSRAKNANPSNPRIVHCSAGVGRSGTFIALEHLMTQLDAGVLEHWDEQQDAARAAAKTEPDEEVLPDADGQNGTGLGKESQDAQEMDDREESGVDANEMEDLIFNTVNALREQRKSMVQADLQYVFIYHVLRKLWLGKYGGGASAASGREGSGEPAAKRLEVDPFVG